MNESATNNLLSPRLGRSDLYFALAFVLEKRKAINICNSKPVVEASENEASKERQPPVSPGVGIQAIQNEETRAQNPNKRPRPDDDGDGEDLQGANPGPSNKKLRLNTAAASLNSANEEPSLGSPVESVVSFATLMGDSRQNTPDSAPEHVMDDAYDSEPSALRSAKDLTLGVKCWYKL